MLFSDQSHINHVRDALWQMPKGCASVMVGAGFSRNAVKAGPSAREFPLWQDIAGLLCSRLYSGNDEDRLARTKAEAASTSGFLRLAQEYEAAFGRGALHSFILDNVPNEDYVPGDEHKRLLNLPWTDVFTTNYDTLLERTCAFVTEQNYKVIRTHEELPTTPRPRIVKLHGSFPAHIPFIFTEEDFRTYTTEHAPFVNTVQQAMMENVFLLIGFSGDDPNFLHWSGWVRDNLGEFMPKIYLAGWLDLSMHRRQMLEQRNIVPIDLANHPQSSSWPEQLRHRYAIDWIIYSLEHGKPYNPAKWPIPPDSDQVAIPDYLLPIEAVNRNTPIEEFNLSEKGEESVRNVIHIWRHNRNVYPGWLMIPPAKYPLFNHRMVRWENEILKVLPNLMVSEQLFAVYEFIWRKEKLLDPLSERIEKAIRKRPITPIFSFLLYWAILDTTLKEALIWPVNPQQSHPEKKRPIGVSA